MKNLTPAKVTMLMFVAVGGLVIAYVAKTVMARAKPPEIANRLVPMPVSDLPPGTIITAEHLGRGPHPENRLERDMLLSNAGIVGRVVKEKLTAATPIKGGQLYPPGETMPLRVQRGMRAVSIGLGGQPSLVDGLIKPGDYVDVLFYPSELRLDPRVGQGMSVLLLEGVKILAINRAVLQGRPDRDRNVVTLELTPEQSNVLNVANQRGGLSLVYNPQGKGTGGVANRITNREKVTLEEILELPPVPTPEEPVPVTSHYVEQWRGAAMTMREFGAHNRGGVRDSSVQPRRRNSAAPTNPAPTTSSSTDPATSGLDPVPARSTNDPANVPVDQPASPPVPATADPTVVPNSPPAPAPATAAPSSAAAPNAVPTPNPTSAPNASPVPPANPTPDAQPLPISPQSLIQPPGGVSVPTASPVTPNNPNPVPGSGGTVPTY